METIGTTKIDGWQARENSGISGRSDKVIKISFYNFEIVSGIPNVHRRLDENLARHTDARIGDVPKYT